MGNIYEMIGKMEMQKRRYDEAEKNLTNALRTYFQAGHNQNANMVLKYTVISQILNSSQVSVFNQNEAMVFLNKSNPDI